MHRHAKVAFAFIAVLIAGIISASVAQAQALSEMRPAVIKAVSPVYPVVAIAGGISGDVVAEVSIKTDGTVSSVSITEGHPTFHQAVKRAASRWQFAPTVIASRLRSVRLTFTFNIVTISHGKFPPEELTPIFRPPYQIEVMREGRY